MSVDTERKVALTNEKVIGNGSFGVVFQATLVETGETVAVKKVLQDKRFKVRGRNSSAASPQSLIIHDVGQNRELQIMKQLKHTNVVELKNCFYSKGDKVRKCK